MNKTRLQVSVVDDDGSVRKALERLFRSAGMGVDLFPSGGAFIAALPELNADCVILDLHMPSINGFDVLDYLAQSGSRLPVVVFTGHDTPESRSRIQAGKAATYLLKPVDDWVLLEAIAAAVAAANA